MRKTLIIFTLLLSVPLLFARDTDRSGMLYGTITMESGTQYQGVMRWGTEEAFWDDIFNSSKTRLEYQKFFPKNKKKRKKSLELFGITISTSDWNYNSGRPVSAMCHPFVAD